MPDSDETLGLIERLRRGDRDALDPLFARHAHYLRRLVASGRLWITDFGLASFTSQPGLTMTGDIVGTLRYMSPEQALAKRVPIDHRTDVYSLGVTLYELLTLETAFPGDDPHKVIQEIASREPASARSLNPAVPAELETIRGSFSAFRPGRLGIGVSRLVALLLLAPAAALAGNDLPEGPGLAARYPGDEGVAEDSAVLLAEDFEKGTVEDLAKKWTEVGNKGALAFSELKPEGSQGNRSLEVTATLGKDTGGHLFAPLARGVDCAFARFYVRFADDAGYIHHFVHMGGMNPQTRWPNPQAGTCPKGDDRFSVGIEPWGDRGRANAPGVWNFYPYWHEMKISADGRHWGNSIRPVENQKVPRARWQCVEMMIKLNKPKERDGELALWLDGKLVAHVRKGSPRGEWTGMGFRLLEKGGEPFEGFSWRTNDQLKVSYFWLLHYVTEESLRRNGVAKPDPANRVWFDDVVVATSYIGPLHPLRH